jgi:GNAT superfamily N-acetyltransferase
VTSALAAKIRPVQAGDLPVVWALAALPNVVTTADPSVPFPLPGAAEPPAGFPDLADPIGNFACLGGRFLVAGVDGGIVAMGAYRPAAGRPGRAQVVRVRVHPALRRRGLGRQVITAIEADAVGRGFGEAWLETATNQPEAMAFYERVGYCQVGTEWRANWTWTLVSYRKDLPPGR